MVENLICENCSKFNVCGWFKKLKPFTDYAKTPVDVTLDMKECAEFSDSTGSDIPSDETEEY
jgi:hypothetical protein